MLFSVVIKLSKAKMPHLNLFYQILKVNKVFRMKTFSKLVLAFALLAVFASCKKIVGEGPVIKEDRAIGNFSSLASSISADVYYKQDPIYKLEVTAQQNILNVLETHIVGNELVIKFRNDTRVKSHERITVLVSSPTINSFRLSGSGNIIASDSIRSGEMNLTISGSGNIKLQSLVVNSLKATISGSGDISVLGGTVHTQQLAISGSGDINTSNVPTYSATTATSGSGEISLNVSHDLDVSISGSGSVFYKGNPEIKTRISGSGKVVQR